MKVIKPDKLGLLSRCFEYERRFYLSAGILALHHSSSALSSEADMWKFLPEELGKEGIPDAGMPKPRSEFLVSGRACQRGGAPGASCDVRVRVGTIEKTLHVEGNRYWRRHDEPTDPEPFTELPIVWETAFGGEGYDRNPLGKGLAPIEVEGGATHPLPNVELPGQRVRSLRDRPDPGCFGPIDFTWPQRFDKAGTYDEHWLEQRFPGFAYDMDWSIFNAASEDQQQDGPFRGDESFEIEGMHPEKPLLEGRLPGMRTRCFLNRRTADGEALSEVPMQLTTVWLFPHAERYLLVFHGSCEVATDDASDVLQIVVGAEVLDEQKSVDHYRRVLAQRLDPDEGAVHALRDSDLLPDDEGINSAEDQAIGEMKALLEQEGLFKKHQRARIAREIDEARAFVASLGLDPDAHAPAPLGPEDPLPTLEELPEIERRYKEEGERRRQEDEERDAAAMERIRESLVEAGVDADALLAEPDTPVTGPPDFTAQGEIERLQKLADEFRAAGNPIDELDAYATDAGFHQMFRDAEHGAREGYRIAAHRQAAADRLSGEDAARARSFVEDHLRSGRALSELNMTGFDLSGLDLRGADLSGAWLEHASLAGTDLEGANLSGAVLARADLSDANLAGANLSKANLGKAELARTKLDGALLSEAILNEARLVSASLCGATLDSADLMDASFTDTDFSRAELPELNFLKADLRGVRFAGANLRGCNFLEPDVRGVDFSEACLEGATFLQARGEGAIFDKARMANVRFVQACAFENASFREAILEKANLRSTGLAGSDFSEARLVGADLSESDLSGAILQRAFAREALFLKSNLSDAVLVSADLMNALLPSAVLRGADLRDANLFQADCARVQIDDGTRFEGANLRKARVQPRSSSA